MAGGVENLACSPISRRSIGELTYRGTAADDTLIKRSRISYKGIKCTGTSIEASRGKMLSEGASPPAIDVTELGKGRYQVHA